MLSCKNSKGEEESVFVVRPTICQKNVEHGQFGEKWPTKDHGEKSSTNLHHRSSQAQLSNPHYQ